MASQYTKPYLDSNIYIWTIVGPHGDDPDAQEKHRISREILELAEKGNFSLHASTFIETEVVKAPGEPPLSADAAALEQAERDRDEMREQKERWAKLAYEGRDMLLDEKNRAERLAEALRKDAAGRPVAELLYEAARILHAAGGGPVADCLVMKGDEFAALAADAQREETTT